MRFAGLKLGTRREQVRKVLSAEVERLQDQAASAYRNRSDQLAANDRASSKLASIRVRPGVSPNRAFHRCVTRADASVSASTASALAL